MYRERTGLAAAALLLVAGGCVSARAPQVLIEPAYSYAQAEPRRSAAEVWPVVAAPVARVAQWDGVPERGMEPRSPSE